MNQSNYINANFIESSWKSPQSIYSNFKTNLSEPPSKTNEFMKYYPNNHTNYSVNPNLYTKLSNNPLISNKQINYSGINDVRNTNLLEYEIFGNGINKYKNNSVNFNSSIDNHFLKNDFIKGNETRINHLVGTGLIKEQNTQDRSSLLQKLNRKNICNSDWKEWNSYSKLLPLAVVELDVQNECNYLSNLFNNFSNTVKGFISSYEFEKLMDFVNIIEVGYRGTIFGVMDRNQDDYITEVEFLAGMLIFRPYNSKEKNAINFNKLRLQFIFFYYDTNRDGLLSIEELAKLIEHISIIKVTINNRNNTKKKKTQLSIEKSMKLAKQVINDYLNKNFCTYDNFYQLVNNGIINGTINLLRCRNDIFLQKKDISPLKQINSNLLSSINNMNNFQAPQDNNIGMNIYNTPLNKSVEQFSYLNKITPNSKFNDLKLSPSSQSSNIHFNSIEKIHSGQNFEQVNITPNNIRNNVISSTVTRKNEERSNFISPNNLIFTPEATPNYKFNYESTSPHIPSEGHMNINLSYYR